MPCCQGVFATSAAHVVTFNDAQGDPGASNTVYVGDQRCLRRSASSRRWGHARDDLSAAVRAPQLAPAKAACDAWASKNNKRTGQGGERPARPGLEPHWLGTFSETINMRFKHVLGLLCAASISAALAGPASAQDKTVKIGAVFPLSGGAASAGVHAKAAIETAMDIINNAHPELGNFPLAKNAGLAGSRRRQGRGGVRRQPGQPGHRTEPDAAPDHRGEGGRAHRRLPVRHHADGERDRREVRHSLRQRRVGGRQSHRARLQMVLPHDAGRVRLRQDLLRLSQGHESRRGEDR